MFKNPTTYITIVENQSSYFVWNNDNINFIKFTDWNKNTKKLNCPDFNRNHWRGFNYSNPFKNFIDLRFFCNNMKCTTNINNGINTILVIDKNLPKKSSERDVIPQ
jgi:hypothetical protein